MAELLAKASEFALLKAGNDSNFRLKDEQKPIIKAVVGKKKDVLGVLPTGFGKSLIFHLLSDVFDFVDSHGPPVKGKSITVDAWPFLIILKLAILSKKKKKSENLKPYTFRQQ